MVSIPYLDKADLGPLADAAASWKALPGKYEALQREFEQRVINHLKGHWEGDAAEAAFATMAKARTEYENAATEAGRIGKLLQDAHSEFGNCQKQLRALLDEARNDKFHVSEDGRIEDVDPRWDSPTASASPGFATERKEKLDSLVSRLERILEQATAADEAASAALERDANGDSQSFNTSVYTSLDAAEIDQATRLAQKGENMTDAELDKLNRILHANSKDSDFTTGFYDKLGPKKTLDFYANLTAQAGDEPDSKRFKEVQELQKNLGYSLATATEPDNKPHLSDKWNEELRAQGAQKFTVSDNTGYPYQPYGYQVLGGILRYGEYDSHFLTPIAQHAVSLEAKNPDMWIENSPRGSLNEDVTSNPSGKGGDGFDPMTGILEGLGHSPEAAEDFFTGDVVAYNENGTVDPNGTVKVDYGDGEKDVSSYLDYFTDSERDWLPDTASRDLEESAKATQHGPDALGHALEAATSGVAYDYEGTDLPKHSEGQAQLVNDIVEKFGGEGGGELINGKDGAPLEPMRDSLGHIAATYMGDIQRGVSGDDDLPVHGASANLGRATTQAFLAEVGQDPDAYQAITASQQAYTAGLVDQAVNGQSNSEVPVSDRVASAVHPGATVAGIMSEARADAVWDTKRADDEEFNSNAQDAGKWVGRGAGLVTGAIRVPVVGDVAGWMVEDVTDSVLESIKQDSTPEAKDEAGRDYSNGQAEAVRSAREAARLGGERSNYNEPTIRGLEDAAGREAQQSHSAGAKAEDARHG
ncbi:hypothetical protein H1V43_24300 [Streptomyces sp. PSKA54]|uniref:Uncharacterized protein n=1 Tax=Streptomyces himalayensis subsp. aureolus TaxID=2758039 RepID=A0A7W2HHU0_9ACTN|nr:DUF6571 family protein [Streptomyces himalayensis]MBA4864418.1 hypothetical protein [Streptomyces himalayensis subsp. aureolus]